MFGLLAEIAGAAGLMAYTKAHNAMGLGPTTRELERACDNMDLWPYSAENLARARDYLSKHPVGVPAP